MENSKIEWTDHTFNPWIGCTKVSDGCKHCYAETLMDKRYNKVKWGPQGTHVRTSAENWKQPKQWNRQAEKEGKRAKVFCASLADVFEDRPELAEWRRDLLELIINTPHLDWLLLTKRPENVTRMIERVTGFSDSEMWFFTATNVWIGTSIENQETADERIPELLKIPAKFKFLSCEPLLGPIVLDGGIIDWNRLDTFPFEYDVISQSSLAGWNILTGRFDYYRESDGEPTTAWCDKRVDWVIVGGESGTDARPMHPDWARSLRDQCQAAGVAFHFKQWGEWLPGMPIARSDGSMSDWADWQDGTSSHDDAKSRKLRQLSNGTLLAKVGKHAAGRSLDGREWNEFPIKEQVTP